ncbi:MAG: hypothetical protein WC637_21365, partial [Victivallales bacterium]
MRSTIIASVLLGGFLLLSCAAVSAAETRIGKWKTVESGNSKPLDGSDVDLRIDKAGSALCESEATPVNPDSRLGIFFSRKSSGLSTANKLTVTVRWLDKEGKDIDAARAQLGFPPLARRWEFSSNSTDWTPFSDTVSVPGNAVSAVLVFRIDLATGTANVQCRDIRISEGEAPTLGVDTPMSGKPDAGPLSSKPDGFAYADNLVKNGALEEGTEHPSGWRIEGDNSNGAATWQEGGAFSGKRCLKIADRAPYVKSWGEKSSVFIPQGAPGGNYANAREEVSARWVSEASPVTSGKIYQASAFVWYANRQELDRGAISPIRMQFLDAAGKVLPYQTCWDDWMDDDSVFVKSGWILLVDRPVRAPQKAVSGRVAVALSHAFYDNDGGLLRKIPDNRGFVLVDNISFYEAKGGSTDIFENNRVKKGMNEILFWESAKAGGLPFVPTSAGFRPNTLSAQSMTPYPGGIVMRKRGGNSWPASALSMRLANHIGDFREMEISCEILDTETKQISTAKAKTKIKPFDSATVPLEIPPAAKLGAYTIRFELFENGSKVDSGETRFALMEERTTTVEERGRMDYPFSLWSHTFANDIGTERGEILGKLFEVAGMGKTWFGAGGGIYLDHYLVIKDAAAREAAIAKRIQEARDVSAAWRKYGVTPMARIEPSQLLDPSGYPLLKETVAKFVSALKGDVHMWRHGTESMYGGVRELDLDKIPAGDKNAQGGANYLIWGRRGTVRQYWAEYFAAYEAAKTADPTCMFGPQCASDIEGNVLRLFFKVGDKSKLDMFGMNTYISAFAIWPPNIMELKKNGAPDLPIFVSEFDAQARCKPTGEKHFKEETDAVRRMVQYWPAVLYSFPNFFHLEQWGMILGNDDGSLTFQERVRPQFVAYAVMTENLGAGKFTEKLEFPQAVAYVRERSVRTGPVAVMWAGAPEANVELEVGTDSVELCDVWGNRRRLAAENGVVSVDLTPMPLYLLGAKHIKLAETVKLTVSHATVNPQQPRVAVEISNGKKDDLSGVLELLPESALLVSPASFEVKSLKHGEKRTFSFDVTPLDRTHGERCAMRVKFKTNKKIYESVTALNFACAAKSVKSPAINADLADWPAQNSLTVDRESQFLILGGVK